MKAEIEALLKTNIIQLIILIAAWIVLSLFG